MTFRVNLDDHRSNKTPVTVDYRTVDRTARAGSDYLAASGTLTFAVGDKWKDLDVTVKDDSVDDDGETFEVRLENPTGGGRIHPDKGTATGTITNTEAAVLAATFPSSRFASASHSGSDDRPQVIAAFSEAVAAFDASTPSVAVAGGTVSSVQAYTEDGLEHAYIFFLSPSGRGDIRFTLVANQACAAGGICTAEGVRLTEAPRAHSIPGPGDGNAATLSELSVNDAQGGEGDGTLDFVVRLHPAAEDAVSVDYATADGSARAEGDYTATSGTLRFSAGETSKTVSVPILDDGIEENDETLTLTLSNAGNAEAEGHDGDGNHRGQRRRRRSPGGHTERKHRRRQRHRGRRRRDRLHRHARRGRQHDRHRRLRDVGRHRRGRRRLHRHERHAELLRRHHQQDDLGRNRGRHRERERRDVHRDAV